MRGRRVSARTSKTHTRRRTHRCCCATRAAPGSACIVRLHRSAAARRGTDAAHTPHAQAQEAQAGRGSGSAAGARPDLFVRPPRRCCCCCCCFWPGVSWEGNTNLLQAGIQGGPSSRQAKGISSEQQRQQQQRGASPATAAAAAAAKRSVRHQRPEWTLGGRTGCPHPCMPTRGCRGSARCSARVHRQLVEPVGQPAARRGLGFGGREADGALVGEPQQQTLQLSAVISLGLEESVSLEPSVFLSVKDLCSPSSSTTCQRRCDDDVATMMRVVRAGTTSRLRPQQPHPSFSTSACLPRSQHQGPC